MGIAISLQSYLDDSGVCYDTMRHPSTMQSTSTAETAGIPGDQLAKGVLVKYRNGYLLAVVPASRHVALDELGALYERPVGLATESEISDIFRDCDVGAIPPLARAYGLEAVIDDRLERVDDIYFEGGDHCTLVHVNGSDFNRLMADAQHADISARIG